MTLCAEKMHMSRISLATVYVWSPLTKNRLSRSGEMFSATASG